MQTYKVLLASLGVLFVLTSCGHNKGALRSEGGLLGTKTEGGLLNVGSARSSSAGTFSSDSLDGDIMGVRLQNKDFDLPVVYNKEVAAWVDYFTGAGRRHFNVYMERKAKMEPIILPRLKEAGLPQDLIYLAMIESGFSTSAHSHAGAVGPWQFIRSTGRLFGMQADWWSDERRDPIKSTEAAIQYLSRLHSEFGDWHLACAAYNSGEGKIRRAISKLGTRDFWEIASNRRALMRETKDYVPKMLAAAIIGKNAEQFGFTAHAADNSLLEYTEVRIPRAENLRTLARVSNTTRERLAELNPELQRCCTPPQRGAYTLRVPKESSSLLVAAIEAGEIGRYADFRRHVVRRGDNISSIAKRSGVPAEAILAMNEIRSVRSLKLGTELVIPERGSSSASSRSVASSSDRRAKRSVASLSSSRALSAGNQTVMHVVKKGDTLYGISRRYAVRVEQIRRWNDIQRSKNLRPGSRIKLYVRNENSERI